MCSKQKNWILMYSWERHEVLKIDKRDFGVLMKES